MSEKEYSLKKSMDSLGVLVPIIKNKRTGHMIDGKHRWELKPDAPVYEIDIPEEMEPIARLAINNVRRNADEDTTEWKEILGSLGEKKPQDVADLTGLSIRTVYRHWPQELKDQKRSEAISEGMKAKLTGVSSSITTQERLAVCEGCHTSRTGLLLWHGRLSLCPSCLEQASRTPEVFEHAASVKNGQAKLAAKTVEAKPQTASQLSSWEHRSESMKVQHSAMEDKIVRKLREKGFKVLTDQKIVVYEVWTEPDFNIELINGKVVHGYVDCVDTHNAKRKDRDDDLRDLLRKKEPNSLIIPVSVKGDSDKEADEKVAEIEQEMKF